jgi:hypothetical protein
VYDARLTGKYALLRQEPREGVIDKTAFLLRRDLFTGFPGKPVGDAPANCDGKLVEQLVSAGVVHGKVDEVLLFHN